jgi:hypothetical protein
VLGDLEVDVRRVAAELDLRGEQVVLLGDPVGRELDVDDGARDAGDPAGGAGSGLLALFGDGGGHVSFLLSNGGVLKATS